MGEGAELEADWRVHEEAEDAKEKADDQRRERSLRVETLHEDTKEEDGEDRRREIRLHSLKVKVEAPPALDHRNPEESDEDHHRRRDAAGPYQLMLRHAGPELLVD